MITGSQKLLLSVLITLLGWLIYFALADGRLQFLVRNVLGADQVLNVVYGIFILYVICEVIVFLIKWTAIMEPSLIAKITKWANKNL